MFLNSITATLSAVSLVMSGLVLYKITTLEERQKNSLGEAKFYQGELNVAKAKAIIAQSPRIANIVGFQMQNQNLRTLSFDLAETTLKLGEQFATDKLEDAYFNAISSVGVGEEIERTVNGYKVRGKWMMMVNQDSPFYQAFPSGSTLIYHNESIPSVSCKNKATPMIMYASLSITNQLFDAQFIADKKAHAFRVNFLGNYDPVKDRLIVKIACPTVNKAPTENTEEDIKNSK